MHKHPFYGHEVYRHQQQEYIQSLLEKYKGRPVNDQLKEEIWKELQLEKSRGHVTIPFKLATRRDPTRKFPDTIEVILDTKV